MKQNQNSRNRKDSGQEEAPANRSGVSEERRTLSSGGVRSEKIAAFCRNAATFRSWFPAIFMEKYLIRCKLC
jgi:hypothetical protein